MYSHRVLAVPVKGFEDDFNRLKDTLDNCLENEDFGEIEDIMGLENFDACVDTSEDVFVETTDDSCQFFISTEYAGECVLDAIRDLVTSFKVTAYCAYSEQDDNHDGAGVGIFYFTSVDEDNEVEEDDYVFCNIDENGLNEGTWISGRDEMPYEPESEKMETILRRIGNLAWDYGYDDEDDPDYHYETSSDALGCFKQILSDLDMPTENPPLE